MVTRAIIRTIACVTWSCRVPAAKWQAIHRVDDGDSWIAAAAAGEQGCGGDQRAGRPHWLSSSRRHRNRFTAESHPRVEALPSDLIPSVRRLPACHPSSGVR
jgi:hypothetical protein